MKTFLRGFTYTYLGVVFSQTLFGALVFIDEKVFVMVLITFSLLNIFLRRLTALISLPSKGPVFVFISAVLCCITLYVLLAIIPGFFVKAIEIKSFAVAGFVIPSAYLKSFWAGIASAVSISIAYNYLYWLSTRK